MRRLLTVLAKAGISAALLYFVLRRVQFTELVQRFGELDFRWVIGALLTQFAQIPLLARRWSEIICVCGFRLQRKTTLAYTFIGQFFSQVLPSTIGGDAVRIWLVRRSGVAWASATYSVIIDRVVGLFVLAALVTATLPWAFMFIGDPFARSTIVLIGIGALVVPSVLFTAGSWPIDRFGTFWAVRQFAVFSRWAYSLWHSISGVRVFAYSLAIHVMTVIAAWSAALSGHAQIGFIEILVVVLPVLLISAIPLSIAGWGVREASMVAAFSYAGLNPADGLLVAVVLGLSALIAGLIGGIVWLAYGSGLPSALAAELYSNPYNSDDPRSRLT